MTELLERAPGLDAVFAANDLMATGALRVLRERGLSVPADVSLVGFDDTEQVAEAADPPLTTVRQDIEGMGRLMAALLLRTLARGRAATMRRRPAGIGDHPDDAGAPRLVLSTAPGARAKPARRRTPAAAPLWERRRGGRGTVGDPAAVTR